MTSAPFPPPVVEALGFRARRLGASATATASAATSAPSLSPGLPPGSAFFRFTPAFLPATYQSFVKRHESASLPSGTRLRKPDDLVHHLLRRFAVGVNLRVRTAIERLTLFLQQPHPLHRILSH